MQQIYRIGYITLERIKMLARCIRSGPMRATTCPAINNSARIRTDKQRSIAGIGHCHNRVNDYIANSRNRALIGHDCTFNYSLCPHRVHSLADAHWLLPLTATLEIIHEVRAIPVINNQYHPFNYSFSRNLYCVCSSVMVKGNA